MAKAPTLTTIATGYYSTTALNDNFDNIEAAFENTLSLDGSTPNAMNADLDMNGYNVINAGNIAWAETVYTVATLPAGSAGSRAFVTDATTTTFASIVVGSGSNGVPVYHDGTDWRIG